MEKILPPEWETKEELLYEAAHYKLAGGNMINVIRSCALKLYEQSINVLTPEILLQAIKREETKQGNKLIYITQPTNTI